MQIEIIDNFLNKEDYEEILNLLPGPVEIIKLVIIIQDMKKIKYLNKIF